MCEARRHKVPFATPELSYFPHSMWFFDSSNGEGRDTINSIPKVRLILHVRSLYVYGCMDAYIHVYMYTRIQIYIIYIKYMYMYKMLVFRMKHESLDAGART